MSSTAVAVDVNRWMAFNFNLEEYKTNVNQSSWYKKRKKLTVYQPSQDFQILSISLHSQFLQSQWLWTGSSPWRSRITRAFSKSSVYRMRNAWGEWDEFQKLVWVWSRLTTATTTIARSLSLRSTTFFWSGLKWLSHGDREKYCRT